MARPRKRPEELTDEYMGKNPLMNDVLIPARRKVKRYTDDDGRVDHEHIIMETTPYTKIYEVSGYKKMMTDLSARGKEMLLYLMHYIPSGKDYMWVNRKKYMEDNRIKSTHTYLNTVAELSDANYIYPHAYLTDVFWINPVFFFKGSRVNKYIDQLTVNNDGKKK